MNLNELKNRHNCLLEELNRKNDHSELVPNIHVHLREIEQASESIFLNNEREMLLADIRFWSSVLFDIEKRYPDVQLRPLRPDLNLSARLERFQKFLQSHGDLHKADIELKKLTRLFEEQPADEHTHRQLIDARNLLERQQQEQSALLARIRQGDITEIQTYDREFERLISQGVTVIYDEVYQKAIPIEQLKSGVQVRLQIQKIKDEIKRGWAWVIDLFSSSESETELQWDNLQLIKSQVSNLTEVALPLWLNTGREVNEIKETIQQQQHLFECSQKISHEVDPSQKAELIKATIEEINRISPNIIPFTFVTRL